MIGNTRKGTDGPGGPSSAKELPASTGPRDLDGIHYEHVLEAIPSAVALLGAERRFIYLNKRAVELYGVDYTGFDADAHLARVNALRPDGTPFPIAETPGYIALTGREVRNVEMSIQGTDGLQIPCLVSSAPLLDQDNKVIAAIIVFENITERRRTEQALKEANTRLETELAAIKRLQNIGARVVELGEMAPLLDEMLDAAIAMVGADKGNIQFLDPVTGHLKMVAHRGLGPAFLEAFADVYGGKGSCGTALVRGAQVVVEDVTQDPIFVGQPELPVLLEDGVLAVISMPLVSRSGRTLGAFSVHFSVPHHPSELDLQLLDLLARQAADIIERTWAEEELKRYAEALKRSNAELQSFAYIASHDLREPLRMVSSYLDLLEKRYAELNADPKAQEFLRFAVDGADRMQQMINDLLAYSRIDTQGKPFARVDMNEVLAIACKDLENSIAESGASVEGGGLPLVHADRTQILLLLENLMSTAIKFRGAAAPQVRVSAQASGHEWLFSVRDNGIGIDPRHWERIFEMFQRLHTRDEYPGTGIGLAICKKIVERHGGRIWVESQVGRGSTFFFTIPRRTDGPVR